MYSLALFLIFISMFGILFLCFYIQVDINDGLRLRAEEASSHLDVYRNKYRQTKKLNSELEDKIRILELENKKLSAKKPKKVQKS